MTTDQTIILSILLATVAMFLWGRWRHDMVAAGALGTCVLTGLVPSTEAFSGFSHPAVITVACVLVLSRGLQTSGAVDMLVRRALPASADAPFTIAALTAIGAVLSGFMNNVGALALLMPVAIKLARQHDLPPGKVLMPLASGTILGGMTTLIGTPANLIVSSFRAGTGAGEFGMFDFAPIGLAVAAAGIVFITLFGRRLVPARKEAGIEGFETGAYFTEARVSKGGKAVGKSLRDIDVVLRDIDAQVIGLVRNEVRVNAPNPGRVVRADDVLVIEAEADALASALSSLGLTLEESEKNQPSKDDEAAPERPREAATHDSPESDEEGDEDNAEDGNEITLVELAVPPDSPIVGRSASDIALRSRYGIYMLAVSRHGRRSIARLRSLRVAAGDVLLMQGSPGSIAGFVTDSRCVPLAERELHIPDQRAALTAAGIMAASVVSAALGLLPAAISFAAGVLASMALRTVPPRSVYNAIDWPVIVLLGALIPVAGAMEATGTASLIARVLFENVAQGHAVAALALILIVSMTLSDLINNAATAAVMCPIAIGTAAQLEASADPFLMAVAIGASCAFLTPIGHQNNTLILGPGGFRFGDYWRLGLPLEILVVAVSIPMLLLVWPL
ncbi:MAG: di/tricarboxylate transporter [Gammaproteobacteria bacterium]|jgi:di/tricarboxylate transporter